MSDAVITIGTGKDKPQGKSYPLRAPYAQSVYETLLEQPQLTERWWSPHKWENDRRNGANWISAIGVAVDLDWADKDKTKFPFLGVPERIRAAAVGGLIPGAFCHTTPHGLRVVFCFAEPNTNRELQVAASKGASAMVAEALRQIGLRIYAEEEPGAQGYLVDKATWDVARLFYTHSCEAKGVKRTDELIFMSPTPSDPIVLAMSAPVEAPPVMTPLPIQPPRDPGPQRRSDADGTIQERIDRWVAANSPAYPERELGTCPVCEHNDCFKQLPGDRLRWFCFSTSHTDGVGIASAGGYHGDAMDIEMHRTRMTRAEILRRDGYLEPARPYRPVVVPAQPQQPSAPGDDYAPREATSLAAPAPGLRMLTNNSPLTVRTILEGNLRDVLRGRKLERNALTGESELGRASVEDQDVSEIRARIELLFPGGQDKHGNERGMKQSKTDVADMVDLVARDSTYNPLQDYLQSTKWDGVHRIDSVAEDILGAERSEINQAIVRTFFLSAVSRAMEPGSKVDEMFILVGKKGWRKSTFFKVLGGRWFSDTPVDIKDKDSYQMMRGSWIYEWAELEALYRARDATAVKGFLSSASDRYRPPYGRRVIEVPRSCVIVGTTNRYDFLTDDTGEGERRYLPIQCGQVIDIETLRGWRDQLWAEALVAHKTGEQRYLNDAMTDALAGSQKSFESSDPWTAAVLDLDYDVTRRTTADVLKEAIGKPREQWTLSDEKRVNAILRRAGYEQARVKNGRRFWRKA